MDQQRSRRSFVFRPQGDEKAISFWSRAQLALMGVNGMTKLTPQSHPGLYMDLGAVSDKAGVQTPVAYVMHSKRPLANAFAIPEKQPVISFSENLTELLNPQELSAVVAHELGHVKNMGYAGKLFWASTFGGVAVAELIGRPIQRTLQRKTGAPVRAGNVAVLAGGAVAGMAAGALANRSQEYAADLHSGYVLDGDAVPLLSGLQKLGEYNQQFYSPSTMGKVLSPFFRLTRSHPDFEERRQALGVSHEEIDAYRAFTDPAYGMQLPQQPYESNSAAPEAQPATQAAPVAGKYMRALQLRQSQALDEAKTNGNWQGRVGEMADRPVSAPSVSR